MTRLSRPLTALFTALVAFPVMTVVMLVVAQDFYIFPQLWKSKMRSSHITQSQLPEGYSVELLQTRDNETLEVSKYHPVISTAQNPKIVSLLFHDSDSSLRDNLSIQNWLGDLGTNSLQIDYRGFGNSTGWPSETGIFIDAETLWENAAKHEQAVPQNTVIVGVGLGSAPATYLASRIKPALLILISPFTSFTDVARRNPYYRFLAPFLKQNFPNEEYLQALTGTSVILLHGAGDTVIPVEHSRKLSTDLANYRFARYIEDPDAGHSDVFNRNKEKLALEPALRQLLEHSTNPEHAKGVSN